MGRFLFGCCWWILRLVAPKQAGSSISEWGLKAQLTPYSSNGQLGRLGRTYVAVLSATGTVNGFEMVFRTGSWKALDFGVC
ncbi:hypothetical protein DFH29DRAFT_517416 [Suillus ampliporus]|nr:hypothetical protein DFH29DRAFT_517416 [Suillus ampliporus]